MLRSVSPFYLLYQTGLAPTNGTSVQLARLLEGIEESAVHLLWDTREAGAGSVKQSLILDDSYAEMQANPAEKPPSDRIVARKWWNGVRLDKTQLQDALRSFPSRPRRAWVLCGNERDATRAAEILEALDRPPFLLHIMDIFQNRISSAKTPQFLALIREANQVVCTSAIAAMEVQKHRSGQTHVLPCCSNFSATDRRAWDRRFRIALTGALWDKSMWNSSPALDLFATAWPQLKQQIQNLEVHYAGSFAEHLPSSVSNDVINHGYLAPADCEMLLRNCHLAYLPVSLNTRFGPYSVPSRLADYLACGLPTITCTSPGTGIFSFVQMLPPGVAINVAHVEDLVSVITGLAADPTRWRRASEDAATYAEKVLHAEKIRSQLLEYLDRCNGQCDAR
jgi:glycosyltransferase involved in cell wall biosynthesis